MGGIDINIKGGVYKESLELTAQDSGTAVSPITYQAYGLDEVKFIGGVEISVYDFKPAKEISSTTRLNESVSDKIVAVNLNDYGITDYGKIEPVGWGIHRFYNTYGEVASNMDKVAEWMDFTPNISSPELFVNNEAMTLARYPNNDEMLSFTGCSDIGTHTSEWEWIDYTNGQYINGSTGEPLMAWEDVEGPTIVVDTDEFKNKLSSWSEAYDMWAYGYWKYNYADLSSSIKSINPESGSFTLKYPYALNGVTNGQRFYVFNLLEELDVPGEWYLDRQTGILYVYLPENASGNVIFSTKKDTFISMDNVENINIRKLNFLGNRKTAMTMNNCKNVTVELCDFGCLGSQAIVMSGKQSENCRFYSNDFYEIMNGGITTDGGNYLQAENSSNIVENNTFKNYGRNGGGYTTAFSLRGVGDVGRHNHIYDSDGGAVGQIGCDTVLEYNEINDVMRRMTDMGVSYAYQHIGYYNRIARYNYIHDIEEDDTISGQYANGFYQDGGSNGLTVHSNIFENFKGHPLFFNGGNFNKAYNNIAVDSQDLGVLTSIMVGHDGYVDGTPVENFTYSHYFNLINNYPVFTNRYKKIYGDCFTSLYPDDETKNYPRYNEIKDNILVNTNDWYYHSFSDLKDLSVIEEINTLEESRVYSDEIFTDKQNGDFSLTRDVLKDIQSEIPGFDYPDFKKIGTYTERLEEALGDSLSLSVNSDIIYNGFEAGYLSSEKRDITPKNLNGRIYVPMYAVIEKLGGTTDIENKSCSINGNNLYIKNGYIYTDTIEGFYKVENIRGEIYIPSEVFEYLGEKVTIYDNSIIVIGDCSPLISEYHDKKTDRTLLDELKRRLRK